MNRIKRNQNYLQILSLADKRLRNKIISFSNKDQIYSICEIIINLLNGNFKVSESDLENLKKYKTLLRKLVGKSSIKNKKYLIQSGGFLEILIPSIVSGIASIITEIVKS